METRYCPNCGSLVMGDSPYCIECGTQLFNPAQNRDEMTRFVFDAQTSYGATSGPASFDAPTRPPVNTDHTDTLFVQSTQPTSHTMNPPQYVPAEKENGVVKVLAVIAVLAAVVSILYFFVLKNGLPQSSTPVTYTISFETGGGNTISPITVDEGGQVFTPTDPTRNGYEFAGWYTDQELTEKASFPFEATEDLILYASWDKEETEAAEESSTSSQSQSQSQPQTATPTPAPTQTQTTVATPEPEPVSNTVTISVMGADGTTRTETIRREGNSERVFADSNYRALSTSEVAALTDAERCIAWNEIIASSNGYAFKNSGLASYFATCSWYQRNPGASAGGNLSATGSNNVELLQAMTSSWWKNLAAY